MATKDKEKRRAASKRWRDKNIEKAREKCRKWQKAHPEWSRNWSKKNRDKINAIRRKQDRKIRAEVLKAYGNKCQCCGEENEAFLTIDHVNNDGAAHRKITGVGSVFYRWLRKNNFPPGHQILCANCNMAKERFGGCPHQRKD